MTGHVRRCLDTGRFRGNPTLARVWSAQLWSMQHGMATLALAATATPDQIRFVLQDMAERLCRGYGTIPRKPTTRSPRPPPRGTGGIVRRRTLLAVLALEPAAKCADPLGTQSPAD